MRFRFQYRRYRLPFRGVVRTAHGPWVEREGVIVRLEDASENGTGAVGFGEASPIPWFGTETVDEVESGCRAMGEWSEDAAFESVADKHGCLRHALADAWGELRGKAKRQRPESAADEEREASVGESGTGAEDGLVRPAHTTLAVAALLPAGRAALTQIAPKAEVGFRVFKWKVGVGDPADELALLDDVCAELPSGAKLRLDANGAWDRRQSERWLERCADRPVEFLEQPVAPTLRGADDLLLGLAGAYPTPLGLDESLAVDADLEKWIGAGWPGVFVVKPALLADVVGALARLERAKASVVFSSSLETAIGAKAALRAAFSWKGERVEAERAKRAEADRAGEAEHIHLGPRASRPHSEMGGRDARAPRETESRRTRALGFGVWPLFADARFDGPVAAPFLRYGDVERIDAESVWNALG